MTTSDDVKDVIISKQFLIALSIVVLLWICDHFAAHDVAVSGTLNPVKKDVYVAIASIAGALLGFVITAFSIVASLNNTDLMQKLRAAHKDEQLTAAFTLCIIVLGSTTLVSIAALLFDNAPKTDNHIVEYLIIFFFCWSNFSVLGIVFIIETMVRTANGRALKSRNVT